MGSQEDGKFVVGTSRDLRRSGKTAVVKAQETERQAASKILSHGVAAVLFAPLSYQSFNLYITAKAISNHTLLSISPSLNLGTY